MRKAVESALKKELPDFQVGDTVGVHCRIIEGDKERTQIFTGTVISRRGAGISEMFTVRRIVNNEGVERTFPLHSPKVGAIDIVRSGRTRRAKLYFLRERVGKATRLQEGRKMGKAKKAIVVPGDEAAAPAADAPAEPGKS
jgi:large subunit ribosomal protein L19